MPDAPPVTRAVSPSKVAMSGLPVRLALPAENVNPQLDARDGVGDRRQILPDVVSAAADGTFVSRVSVAGRSHSGCSSADNGVDKAFMNVVDLLDDAIVGASTDRDVVEHYRCCTI